MLLWFINIFWISSGYFTGNPEIPELARSYLHGPHTGARGLLAGGLPPQRYQIPATPLPAPPPAAPAPAPAKRGRGGV